LGVVAQPDGEKDSRTPNDFTNNPNAKLDEGDDDDADEDELEPVLARGTAGGMKKGGCRGILNRRLSLGPRRNHPRTKPYPT
jgi:hypothetical protein